MVGKAEGKGFENGAKGKLMSQEMGITECGCHVALSWPSHTGNPAHGGVRPLLNELRHPGFQDPVLADVPGMWAKGWSRLAGDRTLEVGQCGQVSRRVLGLLTLEADVEHLYMKTKFKPGVVGYNYNHSY